MTNVPDYYKILEIPSSATHDEIREAYKKQALLNHPDRLTDRATDAERKEATRKFQLVADAYYILGDRSRRESYDRTRQNTDFTSQAHAQPNASTTQANQMFGNVFEEILRPEVEHPGHIWKILGLGAGAIIGFIFANVPGAAVGAFAGKKLGQIRDNKGVAVFTAFQRLNLDQRRDIITHLLTRFLAGGVSGAMK